MSGPVPDTPGRLELHLSSDPPRWRKKSLSWPVIRFALGSSPREVAPRVGRFSFAARFPFALADSAHPHSEPLPPRNITMKKLLALSILVAAGLAAAAPAQTFSVTKNQPGFIPDCPISSPIWNMDPALQAGGTWLPYTSTLTVPTPVTSLTNIVLVGFSAAYKSDIHAYLTAPTGARYNFIVRPGWDLGNPGSGDFLAGNYDFVETGGGTIPCCGTNVTPGTYNQYLTPPQGGWTSGSFVINNTPLNSISGPAGTWRLTIYDWGEATGLVQSGGISGWSMIGATFGPPPGGAVTICEPGTGGIIQCPCGNTNPPAGPGRGCDNSAGTGGATLLAIGVASVSSDTLQFVTSDERPTASSIVIQGDEQIPAGLTFGDGVRCVGENIRRLYIKFAVGGSITAPTGSELTVSARSAQLGSVILPGTEKRYQVFYRDPNASFGCPTPGGARFNITAGIRIAWGS